MALYQSLLIKVSSLSLLVLSPHFAGENTWDAQRLTQAHAIGVNAVSWAPAVSPAALISSSQSPAPVKRFVSGGCDYLIKIWRSGDNHVFAEPF
jgi:protein transport protein SEC13